MLWYLQEHSMSAYDFEELNATQPTSFLECICWRHGAFCAFSTEWNLGLHCQFSLEGGPCEVVYLLSGLLRYGDERTISWGSNLSSPSCKQRSVVRWARWGEHLPFSGSSLGSFSDQFIKCIRDKLCARWSRDLVKMLWVEKAPRRTRCNYLSNEESGILFRRLLWMGELDDLRTSCHISRWDRCRTARLNDSGYYQISPVRSSIIFGWMKISPLSADAVPSLKEFIIVEFIDQTPIYIWIMSRRAPNQIRTTMNGTSTSSPSSSDTITSTSKWLTWGRSGFLLTFSTSLLNFMASLSWLCESNEHQTWST